MQKKILLLLCFLMVRFGIAADTQFHDVSVIKAGANESGYHAFFYAMRFLKRFESRVGGTGKAFGITSDITSFQNTWTAVATGGDGTKRTNPAYQDFVAQSKVMMGFFRGGTGGTSDLTLDEMVPVLVYGTDRAEDFYETSKRLVFAESIAEFGEKLSSMPAGKHGAAVVKIAGQWIALGFVNDPTDKKSHIINMSGYELTASDKQSLSDAIDAIAHSGAAVLGGAGGMGLPGATGGATSSSLGGATAGGVSLTLLQKIALLSAEKQAAAKSFFASKIAKMYKAWKARKLAGAGRVGGFVADATVDPIFNVGLKNNGNTCYQNAVLQAIHKCTPLRTMLIGRLAIMEDSETLFGSLLPTLQALDDDKPSVYDPLVFANFAWGLGFTPRQTADAHEFLVRLFDNLREQDVTRSADGAIKQRVMPENTPMQADIDAGRVDSNELARVYGTQSRECFECSVCGNKKKGATPARDFALQLPIWNGRASLTLPDLLAKYIEKGAMSADNAVECEKCPKDGSGNIARTTQSSWFEYSFEEQQQFMVLSLKRFEHRRDAGGNLVMHRVPGAFLETPVFDKIHTPVTFDRSGVVTITDSNGITHTFEISAVVVHEGPADGVHYWTVTPAGVYNDGNPVILGGAAMREVLATGTHGGGEGYMYFLKRVAPTAPPGGAAAGGGVAAADPFPEIDVSTLATAEGSQSLVDAMNKFITDRPGMSTDKKDTLSKIVKAAENQQKIIASPGKGKRDEKSRSDALTILKGNLAAFLKNKD